MPTHPENQDAATTLITPSAHIARLVRARCNEIAYARGAEAWTSPMVMPWTARLSECFRQFDASGRWLLSREQERVVWERIIGRSQAVSPEQVQQFVQLAVDAWARVHLWSVERSHVIDQNPPTEMSLFARWCQDFERAATALNAVDCHRYASELSGALPIREDANRYVLTGFDVVPPLLSELVGRCWCLDAAEECSSENTGPAAAREQRADILEFPNEALEFDAAIRWARALKTDTPACSVMIALADPRASAPRFDQAVEKISREPPSNAGSTIVPSFEVAAPGRLIDAPLVASALSVLRIDAELQWDVLSRLLLDCHIGGWSRDRSQRALFDAMLRERYGELGYTLDFIVDRLRNGPVPCSGFADCLNNVRNALAQARGRATVHTWLEIFERALNESQWPGDQPLNNEEQSVIDAWQQSLDSLASLEAIVGTCTRGEILHHLSTIIGQRLVPVNSQFHSVNVVSVSEAWACAPDYLWVVGLNQQTWPQHPPLNPLLPNAAQRRATIPGTDSELDFERAQALLDDIRARSRSVRFSYSSQIEELQCRPISGFRNVVLPAEDDCGLAAGPRFEILDIELLDDSRGPRLEAQRKLAHAVAMFTDHAACPFRGFAKHRLTSRAPGDPESGLDAAKRGSLVHAVLAQLTQTLRSQEQLRRMKAHELSELIRQAVGQAIEPFRKRHRQIGRYWELEADRLVGLVHDWIEHEQQRAAFVITDVEQRFSAQLADFEFHIRVDRIDQLADGRRVIIDYKTGSVSRGSWDPPRIDQPQLPIYVTCLDRMDIAGVAYAKLQHGATGYIDDPKGLLAGNPAEVDRQARVDGWSDDLCRTAAAIADGWASVDPKCGAATCRYCDQNILCRISEQKIGSDDDYDDGA